MYLIVLIESILEEKVYIISLFSIEQYYCCFARARRVKNSRTEIVTAGLEMHKFLFHEI
jgi:hypothetical protein